MQNVLYMAAPGEENWLFIVIVVITIIAQIFKASKKSPDRPALSPDSPPDPSIAPEDEIRKFLESLGAVPPAPPPKPVSMPKPVVAPPLPRKKEKVMPLPRPAKPQSRPAVASLRPDVIDYSQGDIRQIRTTEQHNPYARRSERQKVARIKVQSSVVRALRKSESLRSALVLREILGPPAAMQSPQR